MALDYAKCAKEVLETVGGRPNLVSAAHCATRLRLVTVDNSKVDMEKLENIDGVKGVFSSNGQLQIIIGTGTVNKVYDEFLAASGMSAATKEDVKAAAAAKAPMWKRALKTVGDVFVPILPAIVASGLLMGIVEALGKAIPSFESSDWYGFLDMMANTAFAFLPVIIAISATRVFGGNIFLGAVIGLMMVHGGLLNGWNVGSTEAIHKTFGIEIHEEDTTLDDEAMQYFIDQGVSPEWLEDPVIYEKAMAEYADKLQAEGKDVSDWNWHDSGIETPEIPTYNLFGNIKIGNYTLGSVSRHGYQGHVIPVIIAIFFMCGIEKWLHKHVPEMIDLFVVPLVTVFLTALITFIVIGPIFSLLENYVLQGAQWLVKNPFGAMIMGALYPITVVMGLHHMYNVIEAGMLSSVGLNTWMPIASAANFAQFGACLAVGIKAKKAKTKTIAVPSSMSAALGITEPAIFGVNFRFMKPFVCAMIAGAIGAIFGAISGIGATAYGVTGIPGYLTIDKPLLYTILLAISGGIAFVLTWIMWKEEDPEVKAEEKAAPEIIKEATPATPVVGEGKIFAPIKGNVIDLDKIPDETFASGVLGNGVGIEPEDNVVYAPFDAEIVTVSETKHAIGLEGPKDMEMLIHVGIDTVKMDGDGFDVLVAEGDKVKKGQKLMTFDIDKIKAAGFSTTTAVLLNNSDDFEEFKVVKTGATAVGDEIMSI